MDGWARVWGIGFRAPKVKGSIGIMEKNMEATNYGADIATAISGSGTGRAGSTSIGSGIWVGSFTTKTRQKECIYIGCMSIIGSPFCGPSYYSVMICLRGRAWGPSFEHLPTESAGLLGKILAPSWRQCPRIRDIRPPEIGAELLEIYLPVSIRVNLLGAELLKLFCRETPNP